MKNLLYINMVLLAIIVFAGCNAKNNSKILTLVDSLAISRPDSALKLLNSIDGEADWPEAELMHFVWSKAQAHFRLGLSMTEDTLLPQALEYYRQNGDTDKILYSYLLEARYLRWNKQDSSAMAVLDNGLKHAVSRNDTFYITAFYGDKAGISYQHGNHSEVIDQLRKALQYADKLSVREHHKMLYTLGINLALINDASFAGYCEQSIDMAMAAGDTISASHYIRNYADCLAGRHEYAKSNAMVRRLLQLVPAYNNYSVLQTTLALNCINLHQPDSARTYWDIAWTNEQKLQAAGNKDLARRAVLAQLKSVLDYTEGNSLDITTFARFGDSIMNEMRDQQNINTRQLETKNKLQRQNYELVINRQKTKFNLILASFLLIIGGIILYFYIRNRYKRFAEAEERIDVLTRMLNDAQKVTNDSPQTGDDSFFRKVLLQQLGIIRLVANTPTSQNQSLLKLISGISNKEIPVDGLLVWVDLYPIIDKLYDGFYTRLTEKFGTVLSDKELQICCLLCANFSTKEIGVVTQQSSATIYVRKSSIRKKIGVGEKQDIVDYINSI